MTKLLICFLIFGIIVGLSNCGVIRIGKISIFTDKDGMHCGSLNCPTGTRCLITQRNQPNDTTHLVTREKCFDENDNLIQQNESIETVDSNYGIINKRLESSSNGGIIINDPEKVREIEENIQKSVHQIHQSLRNAFNTPFFNDGLFGSNNWSLGNNWPFGNRNNHFGPHFPFNNNDGTEMSNESGNAPNNSSDTDDEIPKNTTNTRDREELEKDNYNNEANDVDFK